MGEPNMFVGVPEDRIPFVDLRKVVRDTPPDRPTEDDYEVYDTETGEVYNDFPEDPESDAGDPSAE